ncbi:hypothetical protein JUJ52_02825 [Virgibacillus sp. AGTR]|uniref:hypothetical protein n=1 Tax=Virgibacillus sp. AGTR TaxID=2812055 RepID=UPI001D16A642|nr:hypothetical protein [Virgibacillus sp. AGTR]MCC2248891.1 hypothetical protein [Virgibacillus sp. AGTR]
MNKRLENLNTDIENKIPTSFTGVDKHEILERIRNGKSNPHRNRMYHLFPKIITAAIVAALIFIGIGITSGDKTNFLNNGGVNSGGPIQSHKEYVDEQQKKEKLSSDEAEEYLTVGGKANPAEYSSNFHLYMAHLASAGLTNNTSVDNKGEPLGKEEVKSILESINESLSKIKYEGEKEEQLQEVIKLTNQAIKEDVIIGNKKLNDIHNILHELDNYFNENPFQDTK